jgi:uncharacterized cupin superfamily protein
VAEASSRDTEHGRVVEGEGWFVLNLADAVWTRHPRSGAWCRFEFERGQFRDFGINVHVLEPGQPNALYHSESQQEGFLVLSGECLLIVEEQERTLRAWDYVHFPPGTRHVAVGAGDGPCAILMVGARREDASLEYPASEVAARHGASAPETSSSPAEAYASASWERDFRPERLSWPPAR